MTLAPHPEWTASSYDAPDPSAAVADFAYPEKTGHSLDLARACADGVRFHFNKLFYGRPLSGLRPPAAKAESDLVREVRVIQRDGSGELPYCVTRDERGFRRGGQPPWLYLRDLASSASDRAKPGINRRLLAQLPAGVSFHFVFSPDLQDAGPVRAAFKSAGFRLLEVETYICSRLPKGDDPINALTGRSIKGALRRARRDLEIVDMSPGSFFRFQQHNLEAAGKRNYRDTVSDRLMLQEGLLRNRARILGARRKASCGNPGPFPMDAAVACLWDEEDGTYKLWRITHRPRSSAATAAKPHMDATKLLVLAVMQDAAALSLTLETDGSTPGLAKFYAIFGPGIFRRAIRLQCEHETVWSMLNRYYPSVFGKPHRPVLSGHGHA